MGSPAVRLLLDTHIFVWSLIEPHRLGHRLKVTLIGEDTQVWLSPISLWECLLLAEKGRLALPTDAKAWLRKSMLAIGAREAPLTHEVSLASREVRLPHQDAADRFLAATAAVYDLTLATADEKILEGHGFRHLANV